MSTAEITVPELPDAPDPQLPHEPTPDAVGPAHPERVAPPRTLPGPDHAPRLVRRAWPVGERLAVEAVDTTGHVLAGWWTPADGTVEWVPAAADARLPALGALAASGTLLVHRAGRRAVVRSADGERFTKVVRPHAAARLRHGIAAASPFAATFRLPAIVDATADTLTTAALRGVTLHALATEPDVDDAVIAAAWRSVGAAWAAAVAPAADRDLGGLRHHGIRDEADVLREWTDRLADAEPDPARAIALRDAPDRWIDLALAADEGAERGRGTVLVHRDLHDKQLVVAPGLDPALLDVDTVCRGDAALDLGNLAAHLALREAQGVLTPARRVAADAAVSAAAAALGVPPRRLAVWKLAAEVRIACLYAYRPAWSALAARLRADLTDPRSNRWS